MEPKTLTWYCPRCVVLIETFFANWGVVSDIILCPNCRNTATTLQRVVDINKHSTEYKHVLKFEFFRPTSDICPQEHPDDFPEIEYYRCYGLKMRELTSAPKLSETQFNEIESRIMLQPFMDINKMYMHTRRNGVRGYLYTLQQVEQIERAVVISMI